MEANNFAIEAFDESGHWRPSFTDRDYQTFEQFTVPAFRSSTWNGLMLDNTTAIDRVYTIVFPTQDVLDTIIAKEVARGAPGALIFAHHLLNYEKSERGFAHIPEVQLEELAEHGISYYLCHAPLDCHAEISTATALANVLGIREQERFSPYYGGLAAVQGVMGKPITFQAFAARLAKVTDVAGLRYDQVRHNGQPVNRVAVVPGNGAEVNLLKLAAELGCDTFVTGQWWFYSDNSYAATQREPIQHIMPEVNLNLLGVSRYATEMVVMRDQMPGWFRDLGFDVEFIPQEDSWS